MATIPWKFLNTESLNKGAKLMLGGQQVDVTLSPMDIPNAVRSYIDQTTGRHILEFRYLDTPERQQIPRMIGDVGMTVGKNSHRLYKIEVGGKTMPKIAILRSDIDRAFQEIAQTEDSRVKVIYNVTKSIALNSLEDIATEPSIGDAPEL